MKIVDSLLNLIYPARCLLCQEYLNPETQNTLCPSCRESIELNHPPFCLKCSRHINTHGKLCRECRQTDFHFDHAWSTSIYNDSMKELIHLFKYQNRTGLRTFFVSHMLQFIGHHHIDMKQFDGLVPVPLSGTRFRERGYNQSALLAEMISKEFSIPIFEQCLLRVKHTKNQALLGKKDRFTNVTGAFRIKDSRVVKDKSILLIDDLLTTGATLSQAAFELKQAGAEGVFAMTLAIAISN